MPSTAQADDRELVEPRINSFKRTRKIISTKHANPLPRRRDCYAPERSQSGSSKHVSSRNGKESTSQKGKPKVTSSPVSNPQNDQEKLESDTRKLEKQEKRHEIKDRVRFLGIPIKFTEIQKHQADEVDAGALEIISTADVEPITPDNIFCDDVDYASKTSISSNTTSNQQQVARKKLMKARKLLIASLQMVTMSGNGEITNQHAAKQSKRKYENVCDEFDNSLVKRVKKSEEEHYLIQRASINPHMGTELIDDDMCDSEVSSIMDLQGDYTILPYRLPIPMVQNTFRPITAGLKEIYAIDVNNSSSSTSCASNDDTSKSASINDYNKQSALLMDDAMDTVRLNKTIGSSVFSPIIINDVATQNPIAIDDGSEICPIVIDDNDHLQEYKITDGLTNIFQNEVPQRVSLKPTFVGVHMEFDGLRWRRRTSGK